MADFRDYESTLRATLYKVIAESEDGLRLNEIRPMVQHLAEVAYEQKRRTTWGKIYGAKKLVDRLLQTIRKNGAIRYDANAGKWYPVTHSSGSLLMEVLHKRGIRFSELGVTGSWNDVADEFIARWKKGGRAV